MMLSCRLRMTEVTRAVPNFRANETDTCPSKKNHIWPPLPDRDRSTATGIIQFSKYLLGSLDLSTNRRSICWNWDHNEYRRICGIDKTGVYDFVITKLSERQKSHFSQLYALHNEISPPCLSVSLIHSCLELAHILSPL